MGVTKQANGKYRARYTLHGERYNVGVFDTELKAKRALSKHRKDNDFTAIWSEKNALGGFEDIPVRKNRKFTVRKPSLIDKIKVKVAKGRTWLKEQLDR